MQIQNTQSAHLPKRYKLWKEHPDNRKLWDIELRCEDGTTVCANRADLACWSDYFEKLITGDFSDSDGDVLTLGDVSGIALLAILDSKYADTKLECTKDTVADILAASDMLQFTDIVEQCEAYMAANINSSTAAKYYALADKHNLPTLKTSTQSYICDNLADVVEDAQGCPDFVNLGKETVLALLKSSAGKWRRGAHLLKWHGKIQAAGLSADQVLDCVDLNGCSVDDLDELCSHPIPQNHACFMQRVAAKALHYAKYQPPLQGVQEFLPNLANHLQTDGFKLAVCWHVKLWSSKKNESQVLSPSFPIPGKGHWHLAIQLLGDKHLSFYLFSEGDEEEVQLAYQLCLLNHHDQQLDKVCPARSVFSTGTSKAWGYRSFIPLTDLNDETNGWVQNDSLVFALTYKG